jgi:hypothetical protein
MSDGTIDGVATGKLGTSSEGNALDPGIGVTGVLMNGVDEGAAALHAATAMRKTASRASLVTRTWISSETGRRRIRPPLGRRRRVSDMTAGRVRSGE